MSLLRSSSRKKFSVTPQDLSACLDQKNSMIAILQAQVQQLRFNQQKYDRSQQQVYRKKQKYENCIRDYQISKIANQQRLDLTAKNCLELKIQVDHLDKELHIKTQQLKQAKAQCQQLVQHNSRRQDDIAQIHIRAQQLRATNELLKMQDERSKSQIVLAREELERQKKQNANINKSSENVKDKCYKTQSYIRNLMREEASLNENLAKIQDENNYLDNHISELNTVQTLVNGEVANAQKEGQDEKFVIASKELELKRVLKQIKQSAKHLGSEKQKMKLLSEQTQQRKFNLGRLQSQVKECSQQINYILAKNNQVTDVNTQLRNDLKVCQRHLQNVMRLNKNIDVELSKYKEVNQMSIKKLQQPMRDVSNGQLNRSHTGKWSNTSRMTATGGFEEKCAN